MPRDVFVQAEPLETEPTPVYPPNALRANLPPAMMTVRIVVDPTGNVTGVSRSPVGFSLAAAYSDDFLAAIDVAVRQWQFRPAEIHRVKPMPRKTGTTPIATSARVYEANRLDVAPQLEKTFWLVEHVDKVESTVDVSFTFRQSSGIPILPDSIRP